RSSPVETTRGARRDAGASPEAHFPCGSGTTLPPLSLHSFSVLLTTPCPLQPFLPAQPWPAPAQAPAPLHELIAEQYTSPPVFSSAAIAPTAPLNTSPAAAD